MNIECVQTSFAKAKCLSHNEKVWRGGGQRLYPSPCPTTASKIIQMRLGMLVKANIMASEKLEQHQHHQHDWDISG